ncbi:MAG: O-antigen ligase family protein [bacterium]|nr:O-antigen ligase family protein [bacterium]
MKLPGLLILIALFVSPLLHNSLENSFQTRRMWSWCLLISIAIIAFFATNPFRVQRISLRIVALVSTIIISSFILAIYPANTLAFYFLTLLLFLALAFKIITQNNIKKKLIITVMLLGFCAIYAQWGIAQFVIQHDLGMSKLGESILNQNTPGVASFYIQSEKYIRAYGPFAHANSFGGVLLVGIVVLYTKLSKLRSRLFVQSIFFILSLGIIASFSRTALIGLAGIVLFFVFKKKISLLLPVVILSLVFTSLLFYRSVDSRGVAVHDRLQGFEWYTGIMSFNVTMHGVGIGNYTSALKTYVIDNRISYDTWDIAPIHSVPLLLLAELGIILFIPLVYFLATYLHAHKLWIFIVLVPALILDHYFVTQLAPSLFFIISAYLVVQ